MPFNPGYNVLTSMNEWYTPERYITLARRVMGGIDLDPASCEYANRVVKARKFFDSNLNGLLLPWVGRVWLNPPYGKVDNISEQQTWSIKLMREFTVGNTTEAILLVNSFTERPWYHRLARRYPHAITDHRIEFYRYTTKELRGAMCGSAFFYLGPRSQWDIFLDTFEEVGTCYEPRARKTPPALFEVEW